MAEVVKSLVFLVYKEFARKDNKTANSVVEVCCVILLGGLIPTAIKVKSSIALPMIYGLGTGLPVLIFAVLVSTGVEYLNKVYHIVTKPKRCIKSEADMLKKPAKAIKFYSDTHDNTPLIPPLIRGE